MSEESEEKMAPEWAAIHADGRGLDQKEIDNLLGFDAPLDEQLGDYIDAWAADKSGAAWSGIQEALTKIKTKLSAAQELEDAARKMLDETYVVLDTPPKPPVGQPAVVVDYCRAKEVWRLLNGGDV
jgi:hypothetical protein